MQLNFLLSHNVGGTSGKIRLISTVLTFLFFATSCINAASPTFTGFLGEHLFGKFTNKCCVTYEKSSVMKTIKISGWNGNQSLDSFIKEALKESNVYNRAYTINGQIANNNTFDVCYRGQRNAKRGLESTWQRRKGAHDKVTTLISMAIPHDAALSQLEEVSKLSYLQHYGVATPLLDWTKNIDIAFYYAVAKYSKCLNEDSTASLFFLDPYGLGESYRLSSKNGIRVGGIALPHNFDPVVRAVHPMTHSYFELFQHPSVQKAAKRDGIMIPERAERLEDLICLRSGKRIDGDGRKALSGPVAVVPKWTEGNTRVRVLESIFTVDGISELQVPDPYAPHVLKLEIDNAGIQSILDSLAECKTWSIVRNLDDSQEDGKFKSLQDDFDRMMAGGFRR